MFSRTKTLLGEKNFEKIKNSNICIVGIGGVGGYVVEMLARSGVENLTIIDFDKIEKTNINRQIMALNSNIDSFKTDEMQKRIYDINPNCKIVNIKEKIDENNIETYISKNFDFVVDAIDIVKDKLALIKFCYDNKINIVSSMGTGNRFAIPDYYITDISKTSGDGLAKVLRKKLKEIGVKKLAVCISKSVPDLKTQTPMSISYQPAVCGCILASYVINSIIGDENGTNKSK